MSLSKSFGWRRSPLVRWMAVSWLLAQGVGLLKTEAIIRLTGWVADPWWLRFWAWGVVGGGSTVLLLGLQGWLAQRLGPRR